MTEPDVDQTECVECGVFFTQHPKDGMGECPDCAEKDFPPQWQRRIAQTGRSAQ